MNLANILVLGSKPNSKIPDSHFDKIYSANGAAERALNYRKKYPDVPLTCVVGASEFARNYHVTKRIIKSIPKRLMVRSGEIGMPEELKNYSELICLSKKKQWNFQKNFFNFKILTLLIAEFFYHTNYIKKLIYLLKCFKNSNFQGVSTGFYAILVALKENPDANIIISGIGMTGSPQFYKTERSKIFNSTPRARVDRFLIKRIDSTLKKRMSSLDKDLVKIANVALWNGKVFQ